MVKILHSYIAILLNLGDWRKRQNLTGFDQKEGAEGAEERRMKVRLSVLGIFFFFFERTESCKHDDMSCMNV